MASKEKMLGIRLSDEQHYKIRFIADKNHRKINDEMRMIIDKHIQRYEDDNGEIKVPQQVLDWQRTSITFHMAADTVALLGFHYVQPGARI